MTMCKNVQIYKESTKKKKTNNCNILYKFQQQIESEEEEPSQQKATKWKDVSYKIQNKKKLVKNGKL